MSECIKRIGRLRSFLRKIDPSLSIINKNGTYRLIISEKSLVREIAKNVDEMELF